MPPSQRETQQARRALVREMDEESLRQWANPGRHYENVDIGAYEFSELSTFTDPFGPDDLAELAQQELSRRRRIRQQQAAANQAERSKTRREGRPLLRHLDGKNLATVMFGSDRR